jgi:hypothetical protein
MVDVLADIDALSLTAGNVASLQEVTADDATLATVVKVVLKSIRWTAAMAANLIKLAGEAAAAAVVGAGHRVDAVSATTRFSRPTGAAACAAMIAIGHQVGAKTAAAVRLRWAGSATTAVVVVALGIDARAIAAEH